MSVVGFVRGVVTITGTDAAWECVCAVVTQHDAVVSVAHDCQQTERRGVWEIQRKRQKEGRRECDRDENVEKRGRKEKNGS